MDTQALLDRPYRDEDERAEDLLELIQLDRRLYRWLDLARRSPDEWPSTVRDDLVRAPPNVEGDSPEAKLRHWADRFGDEIQIVRDVRNRLVHSMRLGDSELRGAVWIGAHLIALVEPPVAGRDVITIEG